MSKCTCAAASCGGNGEAVFQRVSTDLYERIDFQKETIDGLRETLGEVMRRRDDWRSVAETNGRVSGIYAADAQRAERAIRSCETALMEAQAQRDALQAAIDFAFKGAAAETMGRLQIATHLRPFTTEHRAQYVQSAWSKPEVSETGAVPEIEAEPDPKAGLTEDELFMLEAAEQHGFQESSDGGYYGASAREVIDLMRSAREQGRRDVAGSMPPGFIEIDARDLPRDLFRAIFGLDEKPDPLTEKAAAWMAHAGPRS